MRLAYADVRTQRSCRRSKRNTRPSWRSRQKRPPSTRSCRRSRGSTPSSGVRRSGACVIRSTTSIEGWTATMGSRVLLGSECATGVPWFVCWCIHLLYNWTDIMLVSLSSCVESITGERLGIQSGCARSCPGYSKCYSTVGSKSAH